MHHYFDYLGWEWSLFIGIITSTQGVFDYCFSLFWGWLFSSIVTPSSACCWSPEQLSLCPLEAQLCFSVLNPLTFSLLPLRATITHSLFKLLSEEGVDGDERSKCLIRPHLKKSSEGCFYLIVCNLLAFLHVLLFRLFTMYEITIIFFRAELPFHQPAVTSERLKSRQ